MDPKSWGPSGWKILHRMAHNKYFTSYDEAFAFYSSLQYILPCLKCQKNYKQHISSIPFPKRISALGKWVYDIHNKVTLSKETASVTKMTLSAVPEYNTIRQIYQVCSYDPVEWIFVDAIVKSHPGMYKLSEEYMKHLNTFLLHWTKASGMNMPSNISAKTKLHEWVKTHTKGLHLKCETVCNDVCTR